MINTKSNYCGYWLNVGWIEQNTCFWGLFETHGSNVMFRTKSTAHEQTSVYGPGWTCRNTPISEYIVCTDVEEWLDTGVYPDIKVYPDILVCPDVGEHQDIGISWNTEISGSPHRDCNGVYPDLPNGGILPRGTPRHPGYRGIPRYVVNRSRSICPRSIKVRWRPIQTTSNLKHVASNIPLLFGNQSDHHS